MFSCLVLCLLSANVPAPVFTERVPSPVFSRLAPAPKFIPSPKFPTPIKAPTWTRKAEPDQTKPTSDQSKPAQPDQAKGSCGPGGCGVWRTGPLGILKWRVR